MKKSIFILSAIAITISLSTLCVINWIEESSVQTQKTEKDLAFNFMHTNIDNNELAKFIYDIGPRFSPIKMSAIKKANSINDILDDNQLNNGDTILVRRKLPQSTHLIFNQTGRLRFFPDGSARSAGFYICGADTTEFRHIKLLHSGRIRSTAKAPNAIKKRCLAGIDNG